VADYDDDEEEKSDIQRRCLQSIARRRDLSTEARLSCKGGDFRGISREAETDVQWLDHVYP